MPIADNFEPTPDQLRPEHEIQVEILTRLALDEKTIPNWVLPGDRKSFTETVREFAFAEGLWLDDDK